MNRIVPTLSLLVWSCASVAWAQEISPTPTGKPGPEQDIPESQIGGPTPERWPDFFVVSPVGAHPSHYEVRHRTHRDIDSIVLTLGAPAGQEFAGWQSELPYPTSHFWVGRTGSVASGIDVENVPTGRSFPEYIDRAIVIAVDWAGERRPGHAVDWGREFDANQMRDLAQLCRILCYRYGIQRIHPVGPADGRAGIFELAQVYVSSEPVPVFTFSDWFWPYLEQKINTPPPPILVRPTPGQVLSAGRVTLRWVRLRMSDYDVPPLKRPHRIGDISIHLYRLEDWGWRYIGQVRWGNPASYSFTLRPGTYTWSVSGLNAYGMGRDSNSSWFTVQ